MLKGLAVKLGAEREGSQAYIHLLLVVWRYMVCRFKVQKTPVCVTVVSPYGVVLCAVRELIDDPA